VRKVESEDGGRGWEMKIVKHGWRLGFRKEMGKAEK
jgi:hypothetical protein